MNDYNQRLLRFRETTSNYWLENSEELLQKRLASTPNTNRAKNIIYFLGDGMSLTTVAAARIFQAQLNGRRGEENVLSFEKFPHFALSKVRFRCGTVLFNSSTHLTEYFASFFLVGFFSISYNLGICRNIFYDFVYSSLIRLACLVAIFHLLRSLFIFPNRRIA